MATETAERPALDIEVTEASVVAKPVKTTVLPEAQAEAPRVGETRWSPQFDQLITALALAQGEFDPIEKNKTAEIKTTTGSKYSYTYADLSTVMNAIRKPLADQGLVVVQFPATVQRSVVVETILFHKSGQWLRNRVELAGVYSTPQELGTLLAYARRYGVSALLSLAAGEPDTDAGNQHDDEPSWVRLSGVRDVEGGTAVIVKASDGVEYVTDEQVVADSAKAHCEAGREVSLEWETRRTRSGKPYRHLIGMVPRK